MAVILPVTLPKWGLEMSEGLISNWLVAEGAIIEPGTEIVDIETDKIVNALDADKAGVLRRIVIPAGETVPVGGLIAVLSAEGVPEADIDAFIAGYVAVDASFEPKSDEPAPIVAAVPAEAVKATPLARRIAGQAGIDLAGVSGSGVNGKVKKVDLVAPVAPGLDPEELRRRNGAAKASPIAVNFANDIGQDLSSLAPSGYKGRISLEDARKAAIAAGLWPPPLKVVAAPAAETVPAEGHVVPFTGMRKAIARALTHSKQAVPHFYTSMDVEVDALLALRTQMNAGLDDKNLSVNDFLLRAVALALKEHPEVNIHVSDQGITHFTQVDLSLAVAIDAGLVTPVIRNAAALPITSLSAEADRLIASARDRSLKADELKGGTFTLSNLGMYGVRAFDAIINPPQGAILAVGGPRREARECTETGVRFVSVLTMTLSADHRGIDGTVSAQFLSTLRKRIETPVSLLM